ncbi:MAG: hypothetical protein OHK006_07070 [Thermodesulfovibrionales bacterium]
MAAVAAAVPEVLVIGTGSMAVMQVPPEPRDYLEKQNILVVVEETAAAAERYNQKQPRRKTVGAFHLTC